MTTLVITGAAGLVGQNLIAQLKKRPDLRIIAIDKHPSNTPLLARLHPEVEVITADLAERGTWTDALAGADAVVINQAQIGGLDHEAFVRNNVAATAHLLAAAEQHKVPYVVHVSSSVVNSKAVDFYTETKGAGEKLADACPIPHAVLRPTLMFGWFDRKHLGWLARFMQRVPAFPIPGDGRYLRQPLYAGDFAAIIAACLDKKITGTFDISGQERILYVDVIRILKRQTKARAAIVHLPYRLFWLLLKIYGIIDKNPPFTTSQLEALVIPETFPVIDWPEIFSVRATPFEEAIAETFNHPLYSGVVLDF